MSKAPVKCRLCGWDDPIVVNVSNYGRINGYTLVECKNLCCTNKVKCAVNMESYAIEKWNKENTQTEDEAAE